LSLWISLKLLNWGLRPESRRCSSLQQLENIMVASLYGPEEENKSIWVFLEQSSDSLANVSLEILARGRQMADETGWRLIGLLLGDQVSHLAEKAIAHGADEILIVENPLLGEFTVDAYTEASYQALMHFKPSVLLMGATPDGRDIAGRLAVRLRTGLNADCTELDLSAETGVLVCEVSGFGGGVLALIEMQNHRPQMATVRPGVFPVEGVDHDRKGNLGEFPVRLNKKIIQSKVIAREFGQGVDLTEVPVLVVGGRGIGDNFKMMRELAEILGGDVGATRPPVDEGHIERERQIGQTGVVCRPKIAITCGVSGAFHFVVGIQDADVVIAINSDPEAPIFEHADYCIVGDALEVIPALMAALKPEAEPSPV
jgi:electron transfer flavoprotein alpha subunit